MKHYVLLASAAYVLSGCVTPDLNHSATPTTSHYTKPIASGLQAIRPYPTQHDVCQTIKEDPDIRVAATDGTFLIACPKHEKGAISDRRAEGAQILGHSRHWTVLSVKGTQ